MKFRGIEYLLIGAMMVIPLMVCAQKTDTTHVNDYNALQINPVPVYKLEFGKRSKNGPFEKMLYGGIYFKMNEYDKGFIRYHVPAVSAPTLMTYNASQTTSEENTIGAFIGAQQRMPLFRKPYREFLQNSSLLFWGVRCDLFVLQYKSESIASTYKFMGGNKVSGPDIPYLKSHEVWSRLSYGINCGIQWNFGKILAEIYSGPSLFIVNRNDRVKRTNDWIVYPGFEPNLLLGYKIK